MWLINTKTLRLEHVLSPDIHPYAILSHTWDDEEVTFQDMADLYFQSCPRKRGYSKIEHTCRLAQQRGLQYAWVDTCCINKESSAELTEAINSMFSWYQKSTMCFVYLSDFPAHEPEFPDPLLPRCRWFTRGWTLQELIAPKYLNFYDCAWNEHGGKRLRSREISEITGIHIVDLESSSRIQNIPVGRRMSWAAKRQTTREEDLAYCLLGIFDVNMSLIYGEGPKAFMRLQEEILNKSNDMTLFAWTSQELGDDEPGYRGILARSPREFLHCGNIMRNNHIDLNRDYAPTNAGLRMRTYLAKGPENDHILYVGSCLVGKCPEVKKVGIHLQKTPTGFYRRRPGKLFFAQTDCERSIPSTGPSKIYICKDITAQDAWRAEARQSFVRLTFDLPPHLQVASIKVKPSNVWDAYRSAFLTQTGLRFLAVCHVQLTNTLTSKRLRFAIVCEISFSQVLDRPTILWALVCSANDKRSSPWGRSLFAVLEEYLGVAGGGAVASDDYDTISASPELAELCTQLALQAPTPQWARLETRRGVRTGVVLERWPGELLVAFPMTPWYRRGKGWNGAVEEWSVFGAAVQSTRWLSRLSLGTSW